jgi:acyl carrier protein
MVPSTFVVLEALPLTANGKVDRHTLPAPIQTELAGAYVAPRSPAEEKLARIWSELLGVKRVGIHDNFFELGGHSLLATQLISRIRDAIGIELPLRSLFEAPTIAELSQVIESLKVSGPEQQVPPAIVPLSREAHRQLRSSLTKNTGV